MVGAKRKRAAADRPRGRRRAAARRRGLSSRVLPGTGVLLVEPHGPLRSADFDRLRAKADGWIRVHGRLEGLVVHAREFPGWKDLDAFVDHLRFVRDHHRKVRRIAIATDAGFARWVSLVAKRFVDADLRTYPYDAVDAAVRWAGARGRARAT